VIKFSNFLFLAGIAVFSGGLSLPLVRNYAFGDNGEKVIEANAIGEALCPSKVEVAERN
jgi:hypothetical protein